MKHIHTIVKTYLNNQQYNKVTNTIPLTVHHSKPTVRRATRHTLAQPVIPWPNPSYPGPTRHTLAQSVIPWPNPSYPGPTQNVKQNRRRQTPIITMPPLQIRASHDNTLIQLHQHKQLDLSTIIIIITYSSIALISSSIRTCSVRVINGNVSTNVGSTTTTIYLVY